MHVNTTRGCDVVEWVALTEMVISMRRSLVTLTYASLVDNTVISGYRLVPSVHCFATREHYSEHLAGRLLHLPGGGLPSQPDLHLVLGGGQRLLQELQAMTFPLLMCGSHLDREMHLSILLTPKLSHSHRTLRFSELKRRVSILIDGSLIIAQVKPEDAGKYTCAPSNSLGRPPTASAYLTVQYPARVVNMPSVIYVAIGLPGFIRCPVDANPPVTLVKWKKDGVPLRIDKYPGWSQVDDGSIRVAEVTEDSLGTYTCMPYNALGSMGWSPPAPLVLKWFLEGSTDRRPGENWSSPVRRRETPSRTSHGGSLCVVSILHCLCQPIMYLSLSLLLADSLLPRLGGLQVGKPSKSKHNVLPRGSLQFKSLTKEDHGEWECVATNVATSITASTHVQVIAEPAEVELMTAKVGHL
ncbi:hypothetical protein PAMP_007519 [Pampus punctatissimus]